MLDFRQGLWGLVLETHMLSPPPPRAPAAQATQVTCKAHVVQAWSLAQQEVFLGTPGTRAKCEVKCEARCEARTTCTYWL